MANILIINPPQLYTLTQIASVSVPPIGASYIAAYLKANGHQVQFIDAYGLAMDNFSRRGDFNLRGLSFEEIIGQISPETDLIALGNLFSHAWPVVRDLSIELKHLYPEIPIVTGGIHPTSLPEFVLSYGIIDYVVLGEGEQTMLDLIDRLENNQSADDLDGLAFMRDGRPVINKKTNLIADLDKLPFPAYDMIPIENYIQAKSPHGASRGRWLPMIATRGCPYECTFCTAEKMWLVRWRNRTVKNVVDEMEHWNRELRITDFHFEDLTIVLHKKWAIDFCDEIIKRGLKVTWQMPNGTRSETVDDEVIEKLKASGCTNITFAPESGSYRTLTLVKKELDLENIVKAAKKALKKRMIVCCFFIIGYPHEKMEDVRETYKFIRRLSRLGIHEISITTFTALPGSKLFYQLMDEGRIELNDQFFRELLYMSDLSWAPSWIEGVSDKKIARLANWGYFQFFFLSYLCRPWRFFVTLYHVITGEEQTKLERVGHEKVRTMGKLFTNRFRNRSAKPSKAVLN